ncbi:hypothetical protein SAMD00019534_107480 [Acytostelium subglobosum LB1]|uniref:hypothetical protein n=1 Tax=Acytostelium subglobosum LB1 TaxID=1410327 RepID=UPI000644A8B0|nr:hypothetical protein SAMD00019534_107480 [Acytostelium subglobosum LB1]GAM27572.1 hypothetical protein SAMD00019534_107480 [Acytostelium subglobosum LB1]|eukprot:XP_012749637.1 hypothetical protein SAMD00019534_107480 [Acytostelium subglobosum LB1]
MSPVNYINRLDGSGHGYSIYPPARQIVCVNNNQNSIWWPENGEGIKDQWCKNAYLHVYNKYHQSSPANTQFVQINEYSVLIPNYSQGLPALKAAVPNAICSAHAINDASQFGDKSGMSIPNTWKPTVIKALTGSNSVNITYTFCATAAHTPSYWEFYVTVPTFNGKTTEVGWDNLVFVSRVQNLMPIDGTYPGCGGSKLFKTTLTLPNRYANAGTLVARWQRIDPVGECFINCSDYVMSN